jgi:hypothetical protein
VSIPPQATDAAETELKAASEAQLEVDAESDAQRNVGLLAMLQGGFVQRAVKLHDRKVALQRQRISWLCAVADTTPASSSPGKRRCKRRHSRWQLRCTASKPA